MQRWGRSLPRLWRGLRPGLQGEGKPIFPLEDVKAFATVTPGDLGAISGAPEEAYKRKARLTTGFIFIHSDERKAWEHLMVTK